MNVVASLSFIDGFHLLMIGCQSDDIVQSHVICLLAAEVPAT
jgi:hypothetical protein